MEDLSSIRASISFVNIGDSTSLLRCVELETFSFLVFMVRRSGLIFQFCHLFSVKHDNGILRNISFGVELRLLKDA